MKNVSIILILSIFSLNAKSQKTQIDSLINKINDNQLGIRMQYVWYPVLKSEAGETLIKLGKTSTQKLINVLDDSLKGIIAQHILVNIWQSELQSAGWDIMSGFVGVVPKGKSQDIGEFLISGMRFNEIEDICELKVNGLKVYMSEDYKLYTESELLKRNKKSWESFILNQTVR